MIISRRDRSTIPLTKQWVLQYCRSFFFSKLPGHIRFEEWKFYIITFIYVIKKTYSSYTIKHTVFVCPEILYKTFSIKTILYFHKITDTEIVVRTSWGRNRNQYSVQLHVLLLQWQTECTNAINQNNISLQYITYFRSQVLLIFANLCRFVSVFDLNSLWKNGGHERQPGSQPITSPDRRIEET